MIIILYVALLRPNDFKEVRNLVWNAKTKWYDIGVELSHPSSVLFQFFMTINRHDLLGHAVPIYYHVEWSASPIKPG